IPEAWTLRQLGAVRRHKLRLVLTPTGKKLAVGSLAELWKAVTAALIPPDGAEAVAAEITLMLHLTSWPVRGFRAAARHVSVMCPAGVVTNPVGGWVLGGCS